MTIAVGVFILAYWMPWVAVSIVFPHAYPRIFIPLDWLFRQP